MGPSWKRSALRRPWSRSGTALTLSDPIRLTHNRFQHGVSPHDRKDRVCLVGDAGHLTPPAGGQGMNSGFHDAVGLAWRLATVLRGGARPVRLDSYDVERCGEHRRLDEQQVQGFRNSVYRGPVKDGAVNIAAAVRHRLAASGRRRPPAAFRRRSDEPAQRGRFRPGPRSPASRCPPKPGERAPDAPVIAADGSSTTLFDHLYNPDGRTFGWSLLLFDGRQATALDALRELVAAAGPWDPGRPRLVLGAAIADPTDALALSDLDGEAQAAYGIGSSPALVLVRPDGHIAERVRPIGRTRSGPTAAKSSDSRPADDGIEERQTGSTKPDRRSTLRQPIAPAP